MDLLLSGHPSILDVAHKGEETADEASLFRLVVGTTFIFRDGRIQVLKREVDSMEADDSLFDSDDEEDGKGGHSNGNGHGSHSGGGGLVSQTVASLASRVDGLLLGQSDSDDSRAQLVAEKLSNGLTIASACCIGEEKGGPGVSVLRLLMMGEDSDSHSALRLMLTGEERGEPSPLRVFLTGAQAAYAASRAVMRQAGHAVDAGATWSDRTRAVGDAVRRAAQAVQDVVDSSNANGASWKDTFKKLVDLSKELTAEATEKLNLAFLYTAFARLRELGPEFAAAWKKQCYVIAHELRKAAERSRPGSAWRVVAPHAADLIALVGEQKFIEVVGKGAELVQVVEGLASKGRSTLTGAIVKTTTKAVQRVVAEAEKRGW